MVTAAKARKPRVPKTATLKLDLGAGQHTAEGFEGVDLYPGPHVKHVVDLWKPRWPFRANSVSEIYSAHLVEHIPHGDGPVDGWYVFWNEVYRICKPDAKVTVVHPYGKNNRAFQDPTHRRYIVEETWSYLSQDWLKACGIEHYTGFKGNFQQVVISGAMADDVRSRHHETQTVMRDRNWNIISDLTVELKVMK